MNWVLYEAKKAPTDKVGALSIINSCSGFLEVTNGLIIVLEA